MKEILTRLLRMYRLRQTRRELQALSDHLLRDIGLRRDEIPSASLERPQSSSS